MGHCADLMQQQLRSILEIIFFFRDLVLSPKIKVKLQEKLDHVTDLQKQQMEGMMKQREAKMAQMQKNEEKADDKVSKRIPSRESICDDTFCSLNKVNFLSNQHSIRSA